MSATPRIEGLLKATGQAVYSAEHRPPGLVYAALVESSCAAGTVTGLDAGAALRLPGVVDVVSHAEAQDLAAFAVTQLIRAPQIHFAGQPLALVVGETEYAARAGAAAVRLDIAPAPAVLALADAEPYAPKMAGRVPAFDARGDAETALAAAPLVLRRRFTTAVNNHHPMELHASVADWNGGRPVLHTTTQAVFAAQRTFAHAFGLAREDVKVVTRYLGGGFGCKGQLFWPWEMWALLASRRIGRPVRLELTRAQLFTLVGRRQETVQDLALGFARDGTLCAIDHDVLGQTATHGEYVDQTASVSRWLYACPNVTTRHRLGRTNEPLPIPMRAPGVAPGSFALESVMDEAAESLGLDPIDLRLKNFADHDQFEGRPWSSNSLKACFARGAESFGWADRPAMGTARDGRWRVGWGMATVAYPARRQACTLRIHLHADGTALVQCGTQDMGSGTYTALAQMAAEGLGLPVAKVGVEIGDTDLPEGPMSAGSQVTQSFAPAVLEATARLRADLAALAIGDAASPLAGADAEDLAFADGRIVSRGGNVGEPLAQLLARAAPGGMEVEFTAPLAEAETHTGMGFGAVFVEVGVDADLGEVRVRHITGAYAAGRVINPLLTESQLIGGLIGGIGMALQEETVTDAVTGRILGDSFADYLIPVHADMPAFDIILVDETDTHLPGGVKGVGMLGSAGVQAAIANAVHHAVGKRVRRLPIRIEDILGN